jgi:outer membrane protein TolC
MRRDAIESLVATLALGVLPLAARADPAFDLQADPVLARLVEQSVAARPELAQAMALAHAEHERAPQAGSMPDPMLQLGIQNDSFTSWEIGKMESSYYSIMASQTFPWPGKLGLRSEVAEIGAQGAEQAVARVRLSTEAAVRRAFLELTLARDRLALLDRLEATWQKSATLARARYENGEGAQSDVLRAQLELNRIKQRRLALQVEASAQVQAMNQLRAHRLDEEIGTAHRLADLALPVPQEGSAAERDAVDRSPELAAAHLAVTQAQRSVSLAFKSYLPDLTVNVGVMPRGGDFSPMWQVSLGGTLPVFAGSKQSRAVEESKARVSASESNVQALEQTLRLRVEQRLTALKAMLDTIRLYKEGLLVQSEATADSTLAQYQVGKVTFASVLEANAGLIADQDGYLQALAQAHRLQTDAAEVSIAPVPGLGTSSSRSAATAPSPASAGDSTMSGM